MNTNLCIDTQGVHAKLDTLANLPRNPLDNWRTAEFAPNPVIDTAIVFQKRAAFVNLENFNLEATGFALVIFVTPLPRIIATLQPLASPGPRNCQMNFVVVEPRTVSDEKEHIASPTSTNTSASNHHFSPLSKRPLDYQAFCFFLSRPRRNSTLSTRRGCIGCLVIQSLRNVAGNFGFRFLCCRRL